MIERVYLYDVHPDRAHLFSRKVKQQHPGLQCEIATSIAVVLQTSPIIAIATSAIHPHIASLAGHHEAALLLHTSLRDIAPHLILQADNVVDDIERVCSNQTSVHLAMQQVGNHDFIRTTIGDILNGNAPKRNATRPFTIYSAFGLGILDLAVAQIVYRLASEHHMGTTINSFEPGPWQER
jgi:ornithine cyclodeaminase